MTLVVIQGSVTNVEDGQTVTVFLTDNQGHSLTLTAIVIGGVWSLPAQDLSAFDDGSLEVTAEVSDVAGNLATATSQMPVDTTAIITIEIIDADNVINQTELTAVAASGTVTNVEVGQTVTVTFKDSNNVETTLSTLVLAGGIWSITAQDLAALSFSDGLLTATATTVDVAGNSASASDQVNIDTQVTIDIDTGVEGFDVGKFTYGIEKSLAGTTTGVEAGQTVTLTLTDGVLVKTFTTTVQADGSWLFDETLDVSGLDQRVSWQMDVSVTDVAGNTAVDRMPQLDIPTDGYLYEVALNVYHQTTANFSFDIPDATLTLSTDQSFLLRSQSSGQELSIVVAADGLSFEVFRDGDNELVLQAALTGTELEVNLFQTLDNNSAQNLSTLIKLEGLQTDTDGTTEEIITYAIIHVKDTPELAIDDHFNTIEDTTLTGSITGNDYTIEGPLKVENIHFNGVDYPVSEGAPAVIDTGKGQLTMLFNGFWQFIAADNLDNTVEQSISFDYTVTDFDGSIAYATSTITIVDGAIGIMADANAATAEGIIATPNVDTKQFTIAAGSDALAPNSVFFSSLSTVLLDSLALTSNGNSLTYTLSADAKSITATANGETVFTLSLNAVSTGDDLDVTATLDLARPIDHNDSDTIDLVTLINATDTDGSNIDLGKLTWNINDGSNAAIENVETLTFDESALGGSPIVQTGTLDIKVGADAISHLGFDMDQMPSLTAGGNPIIFALSGDGLTLTAHTGDVANPVFTIEIDSGWNAETNTLNHEYTTSLYRPFDQIGTEESQFGLIVTDFDGDTNESQLTMIVSDDTPGVITDINIEISELPSVTTGINNRAEGLINITTNGDPIVDIKFNLLDGSLVTDEDGNTLTQNGQDIRWVITNDSATAEGQLDDGTVIFRMSLPENIQINPESSAQVAFDMRLLSPIDNNTGDGTSTTIDVGIIAIDSDDTEINANINIDIYDGEFPSLPNALNINVNEGELVDSNSVLNSAELEIDNGSDDVVNIALVSGFAFDGYTSNGESIALSSNADGNGWYNAIRSGDSNTVFRIRFNADGKVEFEQFEAVDHPSADGENNLTMSFEVIATDADGDQTNTQTININIQDDVPIQKDSSLTFTEEDNTDYSVQLFNQKQQGADGATVSKFIYDGQEYSAGDSVELYTDTGVKYGTLTISASGNAVVSSKIFDYNQPLYSEVVQVYVTDKDGDTVIDNLTITAKDKSGSIRLLNANFTEDTAGSVIVSAFPGDLDEGEVIQSIIFDIDTLGGGTLTLDGIPVPTDADGNYILEGANLYINNFGVAIPSGDLQYHPAEDSSDATQSLEFAITVNISNKPSITTLFPVTVESVADTPEWDVSSQFSYDINEDAGEVDVDLLAASKDLVAADAQGSEVITYVVSNISLGLSLTVLNSSGARVTVANGQILTADELTELKATVGDNLAGQFSFDIQATTTEPDNGDTAVSTIETITLNVSPVADLPTLTTRDIVSNEDSAIIISDIISGELSDNSGSESLFFEIILPSGWIVDAPSAHYAAGGYWFVSAEDLAGSPPATIIPLADASSANFGDITIQVRSFAQESTQDGIDPIDTIVQPDPHYSESQTLTISLRGVANDAPTITSDPAVWELNPDGNINSVVPFNEDTDIPLSFTLVTSDDDGSETLSIRLVGLPEGASFIDANDQTVNLPVVGFEAGEPVFSVTADLLSTLSIRPPEDFSGQINLSLFIESTELDGDTAEYELNLNIDIAPVVDETATSLRTTSYGREDQPVVLSLLPALMADIDGSETISEMTIYPSSEGMILLFDGSEIPVSEFGLLLTELTDENSPTLIELLSSGRLAVLPPQDADGDFSLDVTYQIKDTSETGEVVYQDIDTQLTVVVDAVVEIITRLQTNDQVIQSTDGTPLVLSDEVVFFDADIDGSEVLDYIVVIMPDSDGWFVTHPNGAIHDGDGRWLIPTDGMTSDTVQEQSLSILEGMTISSDHITGLETITVEARVLDRDDPEIISTNIFVIFDQPTSTSTASTVTTLQASTIDAIEDTVINFAGHLNLSITNDGNDVISFRVLASDLPEGGYFTGTDVIALYDNSGVNIIEYVFTSASLSNLKLHNISDDYAGDLTIPIRIIATDSLSGDTVIDESQSFDINVTPVADGLSLTATVDTMNEDQPVSLGLTLSYIDTDSTADTGGVETVILDDPANVFTIQLLDGGSLVDPSGLFQLKAGTTDTWEFTGNTQAGLNSALTFIKFSPPEHLSGDFRLKVSGSVIDTADIDGGDITDSLAFSDTITINVLPVTDAADIPVDTVVILGTEDTDIALTGLDSNVLGLIDLDGSEVMYITLNGVPDGATVYYQDAGGTLHILPNDGPDGGQLDGSPTNYWTVTPDQLDSLVIKPPQNFNGDMPLTLSIITQELGTDDYVTTHMDLMVGVSPVADGVQIVSPPQAQYDAVEGDIIDIDLDAELIDLNSHEVLFVEVIITSADAAALVELSGIQIGSQFVALTSDGNGGFTASLSVAASEINTVSILPGELAFGTLNVEMNVSSIDSAEVLSTQETDQSSAQTVNFDIELTPEVDAPIWTQLADIDATTTNNIALNLGLELQNPAPGETATLTILGVPDGATLSAGTLQGNKWVVPIADVASLTISGVTAGTSFELTLDPTATLNGESADGVLETITVTVDPAAIMSSAAVMANFGALNANAPMIANELILANEPVQDNAKVYDVQFEDLQQEVMQEMYQRMQLEHMQQYDTHYRYLLPIDPIDSILPIEIGLTDAEVSPSASIEDIAPSTVQQTSIKFEAIPADTEHMQPRHIADSAKPEYGYQDPIAIDDAIQPQLVPTEPLPVEVSFTEVASLLPEQVSVLTPEPELMSVISATQDPELLLVSIDPHVGDKFVEQPGFGYIQPVPETVTQTASQTLAAQIVKDGSEAEGHTLASLTDAIKESISNQDSLITNVESESFLNQSELDEINQLAQQQALLNQS
ncbi:adhesin [Shewanella olleyana]|nr:adhesin [Shewanella olleyana]